MKLRLTNGSVVNEKEITQQDVVIANGRIECLGRDLSHVKVDRVIDLDGRYVLPGMIDDQVHFREPGLTHKGDIGSESRAAVAGGITSYMEMPNVNPLTITHEALEDKYQRASQKSLANFAFYLGASNDNLEQIKSLNPNAACGIKVFMGASTGNMLVDDPKILESIFRESPILVATHCEDTPSILANEEAYRKKYGEKVPFRFHPLIRSEEACYLSSSMAVDLAKRHGTQLHVLHLTTEMELALFEIGHHRDKNITAEVCVHHLFFNENDYEEKGALIKCNPAIKKASDQQALLKALLEDRIDVVATDHAPHTWEEKLNDYFHAPSGLPLVQHALISLLEFYHKGIMTLGQIATKTSHAVADLFKIKDRGYIREGYWADLVVVDLDNGYTVDRHNTLYKCGWSPFDGYHFRSNIDMTLVNGAVVYEKGQIVDGYDFGKRLEFNRK